MSLVSSIKEKQALRAHYIARREALPPGEQIDASKRMMLHFLKHSLSQHLSCDITIGAYYAAGGEMNPLPLLEQLVERGVDAALPVIVGRNQPLAFAPWHRESEMVAGKFFSHIAEPHHHVDERCEPDIVLVPLLAVDQNGHRLGFGGGYYDRTLVSLKEKNPQFLAIGVGYHWQMQEACLPAEAHDIALDYFLSDEGVRAF